MLAADVLIEVDAALRVGDPSLRLPTISPELERQAVWGNKMSISHQKWSRARYIYISILDIVTDGENVWDTPSDGD